MDRRKGLTLAYQQTPRPMGVFQWTNTVTGKMYVAGSPNLDGVRNRDLFELRMGVSRNAELQRDWNEYGEQAFTFDVLERIKPKEDLKHNYTKEIEAMELEWLKNLQPYGDRGYNKRPVERKLEINNFFT
jgi:hypothetical protein